MNDKTDAESLIESLDELYTSLEDHYTRVTKEATMVSSQWSELGRIGGQRADHAASLLSKVRKELEQLQRFAEGCIEEIKAVESDPFGDKA